MPSLSRRRTRLFQKTKENLIYLITSSRNGPRCYIFPLLSYLFEIARVCGPPFPFLLAAHEL